MMSEEEHQKEIEAFEKAKESNRGTIIPIMTYNTSNDLTVETNTLNFDEVVKPEMKKVPKVVEIKPVNKRKDNRFNEMF